MDLTSLGAATDSAAVRKLLDLILITGIKAQAADIHFEPFEHQFRVRNRIDGVLYEMMPVPKTLAPALVARVKVMAHLDIAERRLPQDGKISINLAGNRRFADCLLANHVWRIGGHPNSRPFGRQPGPR